MKTYDNHLSSYHFMYDRTVIPEMFLSPYGEVNITPENLSPYGEVNMTPENRGLEEDDGYEEATSK